VETKVKYKIISDLKLVLEFFSGPLCIDDIFFLKQIEIKDSDYDSNYNFIIDFTSAAFSKVSTTDIKGYIKYIQRNERIVGSRKTALITKTPEHVVKTMLYKDESKNLPIRYKIVSTLDAALAWTNQQYEVCQRICYEFKQMGKKHVFQ
jgi:hypothetical protein